MLQTRFDPVALDPFLTVTRQWYKYSLVIKPPGQLRDGFDAFGGQGQN